MQLQETSLVAAHSPEQLREAALQLLESIRDRLQILVQLPEEYEKLETMVQKHEQDIRKHIGVRGGLARLNSSSSSSGIRCNSSSTSPRSAAARSSKKPARCSLRSSARTRSCMPRTPSSVSSCAKQRQA